MKSLLSLIICFATISLISAQKSGIITYTETIKMNISIEGDAPGGLDLSEFLPPNVTSHFELTYNDKVSTYNKVKDDMGNMELGGEDSGIKIVVMGDDIESKLYIDRSSRMQTEQKGFMGKAFIVEEVLEKNKWKMTGEKVKYLDYECIKATRTNEEGKVVVAWFAPKIPVSVGPNIHGDLPGAILMLSVGDEDVVIKATKVELANVERIEKPEDGDKITNEEYEKIVEEKTKEMIQQRGGTGVTIRG